MAKFCGSCGANMDDDAKVCGACGAPCATDNAVNPTNPTNPVGAPMSDEQKKKITTIAIAVGAVFVAIIAIIVAVNILLSFTGYKGAMNKYFNAIEDYDVAALNEVTSDVSYVSRWRNYDDDEFEEYKEESVKESASSALESFEDKVGNKVKIKYEIQDANEISERKYNEFLDSLEDVYDYDTSEISKVMEVSYTLEIKGKKGKRTVYPTDMYLIKEDGKWTVYQGSLLY